MNTRIVSVSLGAVVAVVASLALFAGSASGTLPGGGGGGVCTNHAENLPGGSPIFDEQATASCYAYAVGFYAYNANNTGDVNGVCKLVGYETAVFEGKNEQTKPYDKTWCPDGTWHYYYANSGTSDLFLTGWAQYFFIHTYYYIELIHT